MTARTGAQAALGLGLLASLAGNALAAQPTALGRLVASWAPLALALVVWLVEHHKPAPGAWRAATWGGTAVVAGVAAWVSYWHLVELARMAGEEGIAAHLLPLSVDGLVIVASAYLRDTDTRPAPKVVPVRKVAPAVSPAPRPAVSSPVAVTSTAAPVRPSAGPDMGDGADRALPATSTTRGKTSPVSAETVRRLAAEHPDWTQAQVAEAAGCSVRTVRRHLNADTPAEAVTDADIDALLDQMTDAAPEAAATNGAHA